jgi:PKD repeat protein
MRFEPSLGRRPRPPSRLTRHGRREGQRGQSMVELAIITPVLLLFVLIALDFGRVYLGYINLQNLARIAANFAATNPDTDWGNASDPDRVQYTELVLNDATATNCDLPGDPDVVPDPVFTDQNGDGSANGLGDLAAVRLTCGFGVITPVISQILGNVVNVSAEATFPVRTGGVADAGGGGGPGRPTASFSADPPLAGSTPFIVQFRDESGGGPTSWFWDFGDGSTSTLQDPVHVYDTAGVFTVTLTVGNTGGVSAPFTRTNYISVVEPGSVDFVGSPTSGPGPLDVTFSYTSPEAPTAVSWDFGNGDPISSQDTPTATYTAAGSPYTVTLTLTLSDGDHVVTKVDYINVDPTLCTVPAFIGTNTSGAQALWASRGFSTSVTFKQKPDYEIKGQSLTGNSQVSCDAVIELSRNP